MPKQSGTVRQAQARAQSISDQMGYNLVDAELVKESTGRFLRFFIDKQGGVTLDDCEAFHRRVQPLMDDIDYDYMEVSSPGVDRPLKKDEDFARRAGEKVEVRLFRPLFGAKTHIGILVGLRDGEIVVTDGAGRELSFERKQVALVKPVYEMDEETLKALEEEEIDS